MHLPTVGVFVPLPLGPSAFFGNGGAIADVVRTFAASHINAGRSDAGRRFKRNDPGGFVELAGGFDRGAGKARRLRRGKFLEMIFIHFRNLQSLEDGAGI